MAGQSRIVSPDMIVDGYIRVSQVNDRRGERFISPAVQREAIEGMVRLHRAVVGKLFEELDESAAWGYWTSRKPSESVLGSARPPSHALTRMGFDGGLAALCASSH